MKNHTLHFSVTVLSFLTSGLGAEPLSDREPRFDRALAYQQGKHSSKTAKFEATVKAISATPPQERLSLLVLLNRGSENELMKIPGVAKSKARIIIQSRPIFELSELLLLKGFGPQTVSHVLAHGQGGVGIVPLKQASIDP